MKREELCSPLLAEIRIDYFAGMSFIELNRKYNVSIEHLRNIFIRNSENALANDYETGLNLCKKAEMILIERGEGYHTLPPEIRNWLDSIMLFFASADLNNHSFANLHNILENEPKQQL